MKFLYAAYIVTWLIHIGYLGTVVARYKRLRKEVDALAKK
jgi:hypothetical protein